MLGALRRQLRLEHADFRMRRRARRVRGARSFRRPERRFRDLRAVRRRLEVGAREPERRRHGGRNIAFPRVVRGARARRRPRRRRRRSRASPNETVVRVARVPERNRSLVVRNRTVPVVPRLRVRLNGDVRSAFYALDPRPHRRPRRRRDRRRTRSAFFEVPTRLFGALRRLLVALGIYLAELALRLLAPGAPRVAVLLHGSRLRPERLERRAHHLGRPRGGWQLPRQRVRVKRLVAETFRERVRVVEPALDVRAGALERREGHARVAGYHRRRRRGWRIPRGRRRGVLHRARE